MAEVHVPKQIARTIELIKRHPGVKDARIHGSQPSAVHILVEVDLIVELPSKWAASGESSTGVRSVETAIFCFPRDYPVEIPAVLLREDFNRSLPHIVPGHPTGPVVPCIFDGNLSDLLQRGGIWAIVDQLGTWLDKAATNALIDPDQGWEPIRRDELHDCIVARASELQQYGNGDGPPFRAFHDLDFITFPRGDSSSSQRPCFYGTVGQSLAPSDLIDKCDIRKYATHSAGHSIAIIIRANKVDGRRRVADRYFPDTVKTAEELSAVAQEYGCSRGLEDAFALLRSWVSQAPEKGTLPLVIVFCANRPFKIIGSESRVELVPYVTELKASFAKSTAVYPVSHRDAIDVKLLRRLSGTGRDDKTFQLFVQLGCGSLGSKIAVHLTRAGYGPSCLVDKAYLMPHHAARHALLPSQETADSGWWGFKAEALRKALAGLGHQSSAVCEDIKGLSRASKDHQQVFDKDLWAIINSTASLSIREWLSSLSSATLPSRIIETCLYGTGRVGLVTVEGPNRNPNSSDLAAYTHLLFSEKEHLRQLTLVESSGIARRLVGQGCGSPTMIVSDMRVSMFAASIAQNINLLQRSRLSDVGKIWIGVISEDELNLNWQVHDLSATAVLKADNSRGWTVRLLAAAREKIERDCQNYSNVETGGVVAGFVSEVERAVVVVDIIPAPEDSRRSASEFVLGTRGLRRALEEYCELTGGSLYCVGTWHSHLLEQGPSSTDRATAKIIGDLRPFPAVMLVKTPSQYRALVLNVDDDQ
jgi:hypothetical protein